MRTLLIVVTVVAVIFGGYQTWRAERALAVGHDLAAVAEAQQNVIEGAGQIARIMENGAQQCAAHGQEPVALCFRLAGGKVVEAKGVCSSNEVPSRATRRSSD